MESDVPANHSAEEELRKLGDVVSLLRKRQRRFRRIADLEQRSQQDLRLEVEKIKVLLSAHKGSLHFKDGIQRFRFKEVLSATNNFSNENLITKGTLGKVYKGQLLWDGNLMNFTVRRLNYMYSEDESHTEISMLKSLKHKNIISIFGRCDENNETIIIYGQAFHGTLDQHISDPNLTWSQRLQICLGVARALHYIHCDIIHCDINSSKVFLDHDWEPKIYGFELSTNNPQGWRHRLLYSRYFGTDNVTLKYDVYCFGVLLLEVLWGRKRVITNDVIQEAQIDSYLWKRMDKESSQWFKNLADKCLNQQLMKRPSMDQIVKELEEALELHGKHANLEHPKAIDEATTSVNYMMDLLKIPLSEIKQATEDFKDEYVVGGGAYGKVYKAELDVIDIQSLSSMEGNYKDEIRKINKTVAIKRIYSRPDEQGKQGFLTEIKLLTSCKHPNIVSLLGYSSEASEMILVYEYAFKGSLGDYLGNDVKNVNLTWGQRMQICLDIARGIDYIHTNTEGKPRIIHRDIKSDNILLDRNLNAKLADFGLSTFHGLKQPASTVYTNNLAGTNFYMDPEYMSTHKYKTKSDIYSFGVVLFEVLSGNFAYDDLYVGENEMGLAAIARRRYHDGTLKELIDPKIKEEDNDHIFTLNRGPNQDSFEAFSNIAYRCLSETQAKRPSIKVVITEFENALNLQGETMVLSRFRLDDIRSATKNFARSFYIGSDANGMVYKAKLDHFGNSNLLATERKKKGVPSKKQITIKRITSRKGIQGKQEFFAELEMGIDYKPHNAASLLGFCDEVDEMILVYDYAPER
ncbi:putative protein kinase RLK-Pelle-CR4L family [Helianthus annuus]|uniref:non-specific serine/threonine protein kinase n=1 Tax=Helianthus annuus TaxID=4232 RepID=A0A9K3EN24_HELAN|nr:putative protein kinase RLK-Pelle-CR4L family [Helianthus annuus]